MVVSYKSLDTSLAKLKNWSYFIPTSARNPDTSITGPWFDYLMVSKKEMKEILKGTDWKARKFVSVRGDSQYIALLEKTKG